jgi:hypothetical protein
MFARVKKSGNHQYLQIVENRKLKGKVVQRVIATIGRMDQLKEKDRIETLIRSLSRFSEKVLLMVSGKSDVVAHAKKIGPALIFERVWEELSIKKVIQALLSHRKFEFDVERAIFLTVLHRLFVSGSDRSCEKWCRDYKIRGVEGLSLHHLYRAMTFLGEQREEQRDATSFSPRCTKDLIEEGIFLERRDLFTGLDLIFFDTTSLYFEGKGGVLIGQKGHSKDHRPDLNQMVVGAVIDNTGKPVCCEMWPGNRADVTTLIPVMDHVRSRFNTGQFCIVADRGMVSAENIDELGKRQIPYIFGARMRKVKEIRDDVLSSPGRYREVRSEGRFSKDPAPLKVKEVVKNGKRYLVCLNPKQARKDAHDRQSIIDSLEERIKTNPKSLIGNKGYRKYLAIEKGSVGINQNKVQWESRFDGKWVLITNTNFSAEQVALKYKELWQVEQVFRDVKSILETRPVYHQKDENIRGHVFCSFLALVLRKELDRRLQEAGQCFEWADIKQDLKALQEVAIEDSGKALALRTECVGTCSKIFKAMGVAIPPTIREL